MARLPHFSIELNLVIIVMAPVVLLSAGCRQKILLLIINYIGPISSMSWLIVNYTGILSVVAENCLMMKYFIF
jgi:hypothetical protein